MFFVTKCKISGIKIPTKKNNRRCFFIKKLNKQKEYVRIICVTIIKHSEKGKI